MKDSYQEGMSLEDAVAFAVGALSAGTTSTNGDNGQGVSKVEIAVLERSRPRRAFRRIEGAALTAVLPAGSEPEEKSEGEPMDPPPEGDGNGGKGKS